MIFRLNKKVFVNLIAALTVVVAFSRSSIFKDLVPMYLVYTWFGVLSLMLILFSLKHIRIHLTSLFLVIVSAASIMVNDIDSFFMPWQRLVAFLLFMFSVGPLMQNNIAILFKSRLHKVANFSLVLITIVSLVGFLSGSSLFSNSSGFFGLTIQPMMLGPIAALSSLVALKYFFLSYSKHWKIIFLVVFLSSLLTCVIAASRAAVVAVFLSIIAFLLVSFWRSPSRALKAVVFILVLLTATSTTWIPYSEQLVSKHNKSIQSNNMFSGRERMWEDRIQDFKESPLIGVGFASMKNTKKSLIRVSGTVEPGTGWLFVLSSIGLIGFVLFAKLLVYPIFFITNNLKQTNFFHSFIVSALFFFVFHLFVEGYALSAGGFLFFYLWLTIAVAQKKPIMHQLRYDERNQ